MDLKKTSNADLMTFAPRWPNPDTGTAQRPRSAYASASFVFDSSAHGADLFALKDFGNIYSRIGNPTVDSAQLLALTTLAEVGDNIVASAHLYGGSFKVTFRKFGITARFIDSDDPSATFERTRALYVEIIANTDFRLADIKALSEVAHAHHIPLVVDNTFGMCGPLDLGADIVTASATKWIGGHGTTIGGVVVDGGDSSLGDAKTLVIHPASPTHQQLSEEELKASGVRADLIRVSVGIDIIADFDYVLRIAFEAPTPP
ncbi:putative O-acetylhomoserine-lyase [Mycena amicta]|nr:putative O-acetylhomoserine-lyase [Mycena amicta]